MVTRTNTREQSAEGDYPPTRVMGSKQKIPPMERQWPTGAQEMFFLSPIASR